MVKATCNDLSYTNIKTQLEKIGFGKSTTAIWHDLNITKGGGRKQKCTTFKADSYNTKYSENSCDKDVNQEPVYFCHKKSMCGKQTFKNKLNFQKNGNNIKILCPDDNTVK